MRDVPDRVLPASSSQRAMWFEAQLSPESVRFNVSSAVRVRAEGDAALFRRVLQQIVDATPSLRTRFVEVDGEPFRRVDERADVDLAVVDASTWSAEQLDDRLRHEHLRPFDLEHGPLVRFVVLSRSAADHVLAIVLHHSVTDLWSNAVLWYLVAAVYQALDRGEPVPGLEQRACYADFVDEQRALVTSPKGAATLDHWRPVFDRWVPQDLFTDRSVGDTVAGVGGVHKIELHDDLVDRLREWCRKRGVSLRSAVLAAFQVVLHLDHGLDSVVVGEIKANRSVRDARSIACYMNPVARSASFSPDSTLGSVVDEVEQSSVASRPHERYPFETLLHELRPGHGTVPFFAASFSWQKTARVAPDDLAGSLALGERGRSAEVESFEIEPYTMPVRSAPLPLSLLAAAAGERLGLALEYQVERFEPASMERLGRHLASVLSTMIETPDALVAEVDLVSETEREAWRREWDAVQRPLDPTLSAHRLFEQQAARAPARVAVRDADGEYTYADLDLRANRLAQHLGKLGVLRGDLVGICLDRTVDMVVAMIAVWKSGAGYVPMDPSFPRRRLEVMVEDAGTKVVVTRSAVLAGLDEDGGQRPFADLCVVDLDRDAASIAESAATPPEVAVGGDDVAYVIFTSGSTGRPKGVAVDHRNVVNFLTSMGHRPGLGATDVVLASTTLSFDISVLELALPLTVGAEVHVVDRDVALDPQRLAEAMRRVTVAQATPTTWRMLIDAGWAGQRGLTVLCGGEPMSRRLADDLLDRCDTLWNLYGPTETTVWSSVARIAGRDSVIPLGEPVDNTRLYVMDGDRLVPDGTRGELWIAGAGVARGYVGRPDLTAERFLDDPFHGSGERMYRTGDLVRRGPNGELEFLGRVDDQVKVRGHRIELGEVESALERHPVVDDAVAAVRDYGSGDQRLVAYVVVRDVAVFDDEVVPSLREHLRRSLPDYMVPAAFVPLDRIPRTPNEKVDRNALPDPRPAHLGPRETAGSATRGSGSGDLVAIVVGIYREVLGDDRIGPDDNFFELGGHSILATRLAARLRRRLECEVPLRAIFDNPTPAALAAAVEVAPVPLPFPAGGDIDGVGLASQEEGVFDLSHSQERMWFMQQLHPGASAYNLVAALRVRGRVDREALRWALDELVRRHTALRTVFFDDGGVPRLRVMEPFSPDLEVRDLVDVEDVAARSELVRDELHRLGRRPFDLSSLPLFRMQAYRIGDDDHVLGLVMHHIIADQWSFGVLARELTSFYEAYQAGRDVAPSAAEMMRPELYARQERLRIASPSTDASLAYWRRQLAGVPVVEIPADRPRPASPSMVGHTIVADIPDELSSAVRRAARRQNVSEFMVLLAAFKVLVHRMTGATDLPIGVPTANRHWLESESLISTLVNTLVIRTDLSGSESFSDVVRRVREVSLDAFEHQDVPFERLVQELAPTRDLSRSPLFQLFFNVQNAPFELPSVDGLEFEVLQPDRRAAQFDLSLTVDTAVTNSVTLEYAVDLYDEVRMQRLLDEYLDVLRQGVGDGTIPAIPIVETAPSPSTSSPTESVPAETTPVVGVDDSDGAFPTDDVEHELAEIWADVLGVAEVGRHDDFFDLGGHSLLAVRIMAAVHQQTGRRPPITALFQAPTVAELAALLRSEGWLTPWTSLVEVQRSGNTTPLFYVSPYLISALSFHGLAEVLDDDVPFYVLQPQGIESDHPIHRSVEEMAAHYLRELKTVQPHGPYRIGGHCAGGWVAFEMARQLQEAGEQVERLIVVDVEPPGMRPPRRKWLQYVASRVVLYGGSGRLLDAARWQFDLWRERLRVRRADGVDDSRAREVRAVHREAHRIYPGGRIEGDLVLIRSEEWARLPDKAWHLDWRQLVSGETEVRQVPGAHSALLHLANVEELGGVMRSVIGVR